MAGRLSRRWSALPAPPAIAQRIEEIVLDRSNESPESLFDSYGDEVGTEQPAPEVRYEAGLYEGGRTAVFDLLGQVPDTVQTVLVVGHNPTMSEVSILLIPDDQYDGKDIELKTSGLAVHRADGPWSGTEPGSMRLVERHTARG